VASAGLQAFDVLTVELGIDETELGDVAAGVSPDVLAEIAADPSSRVYQFFIVAAPGQAERVSGGLLQALMARVRSLESAYHRLEDYAAHVESDARVREESARVTDVVADRDALRRQLAERMAELEQMSETIVVLLRDVAVQREFAESLAAQVPRIAERGGEAKVLDELDGYHRVAPTPTAAAALAAEATEFRRLQRAVAFRAVARLDAWSHRVPRVRAALRRLTRRFVG
jgi:hypothetical protein